MYLAEPAENAEKDEIEYLHQNRRRICSDETTHPTGKVVKPTFVITPQFLMAAIRKIAWNMI